MYYVYIIQSEKNNSYYIGSSFDPNKRLLEHNSGKTIYTKLHRPWKLVFTQKFNSEEQARKMEKKLKNFKSRSILQQIIADGFIKTSI